MSNKGKKYKFATREAMLDEVEVNTAKGDKNICGKCYEVIETIIVNGQHDRSNRVDCEEDDGSIISYHKPCYVKVVYES